MYVKQHYVPQFYLKSFATRKARRYKIKCYNKESGNEFKENVRNIGMENYFYDKGGPPQIETLFADKEKIHSKVYQKIVSQKSIAKINTEEKNNMSEYIFYQNERTRSTRERNRQITKEVYFKRQQTENLPNFDDLPKEYQKWLLESRGEMGQINILFNEYIDEHGEAHGPDEIVNYISQLEWNLTKNNLSLEFYTSDHPIVVYNPIYVEGKIIGYGSNSYRAEGVEIYFPLTPRLCLILYDEKKSDYRKVNPERQVLEKELAWINTQIIAKAHRLVFAKNNDFQFVQDRLEEYPELSDPSRDRINF